MKGNDDREPILMDIKEDHLPLIISFAGLGDDFEFRKSLSLFSVNAIYIRDLKHNWYLNGVSGIGDSVSQICEFIKSAIDQHKPSRVFTIGASAGGFAAILYGNLIDAHKVMAFSPQTFMDKFHRVLYYDYRWKDRVKQIYAGNEGNRQYLDVKPFAKNLHGSVSLFYDRNHRLDYLHCRRMKNKNIIHFKSDGGGHNLVKMLRDSGKLNEYIEDMISGPINSSYDKYKKKNW